MIARNTQEAGGSRDGRFPLRRRITVVDGRRVHLWSGGEGPAVVLTHGSPGNAWLVKPLAERLARDFSVYAIDTPGFGGSDSLPGPIDAVAQLAEGYRDILDALALPRVLIYGTHSGAAIGLELARRHPSRVSGFVLEGVPAFTAQEQRPLLCPDYLMSFDPDILGGQYSRTWTRFHDQFVWFPWYQRDPSNLNEASAGSATDIHLWVEMYFQALQHDYPPAYRAVIGYGAEALAAAREVSMPGVYLAERSDMLFTHLDRLPPLHPGQRIERVMDCAAVPDVIETALKSLPRSATGTMPPPMVAGLDVGFHDLPNGELLIRSRDGAGAPTLLLHDAPGAGRALQELYEALGHFGPVLLPDLPGCGESDDVARTLAEFADVVADLLDARTSGAIHVYGVGFGGALALELNRRRPDLVQSLTVTGLLRTRGEERRAMIGRLAPPIVLAEDGSHWYRTWLMLRDSLVRWPWYVRSAAALRRQALPFDAAQLHAWTCDVMRQWHSYHRLIDAALAWEPQEAIAAAGSKLTVAVDPGHALHTADLKWAAGSSGAPVRSLVLPALAADRAGVLAAARVPAARAR